MTKVITLGKKLYDSKSNPKQALAMLARERFVLYGGAFGGGKTAWLVNEGIKLSMKYSGNVGYLCRFQLTDLLSSTLLQLEKFLPVELIKVHHKTEHYYLLRNGSKIYYGGAKSDEETQTKVNSMELGWFAVDQAEEITEKMFLLLAGRLRLLIDGKKPRYKGLMTCNPDPGWLRDRFIENSHPDHIFIAALPKDNIAHLPDDYEEKLRAIYPEGMVKRLLEGNWDVDLVSNRLIPYAIIRQAVEREILPSGDKIAGVDVSRYGGDETVFILRQGGKILHIEAWAHQDTTYSAGRVAGLIRKFHPVETRVDSVGLGAGVIDPLRNAEEDFHIVPINVGESSLDKEIYRNKRAEYFSKLAKLFENGKISIPDNQKLCSQLASLKYQYDGTRLYIESKEKMRKEGGKSPDYADALMLAFSGGDRPSERIRPISTLTFKKDETLIDKILAARA